MTSSHSNIWKRFLFNNQSTIYNNEHIQYNIQIYDKKNELEIDNSNNINNIEQFIYYHYEYIIIFLLFIFNYLKKNIF